MHNPFVPLASLPFRDVIFFRPPEPAAELRAVIISAGHERRLKGEAYDWHGDKRGSAQSFIWQYTLDGRGRLAFGNRECDVLPGDAMLLKIPEGHRYWMPEDSDAWEFIYIVLGGSEAIRLGLDARNLTGPLAKHLPDSQTVRAAAAILSGGFNRRFQIETRCENSRRAYSFMMDLLSETTATLNGPTEFAIKKACEHCLDHIAERIDVADLAKVAGLSRWHFSRSFRKSTGVSPARYILETKMNMATHLLQNSNLAVKEVASRCGYADVNYFCKAFKAVHGISPGAFRTP